MSTSVSVPAKRWLLAGLTGVAVVIAFMIDRGPFVVVPLLFVIVVPFEKLFPRHRGQRIRRPLAGLDVRYALLGPLLNVATVAVVVVIGVVSFAWLPGLLLRPAVDALPGWAVLALAVVAFDLLGYWAHRWMHEVPELWRFHSIHHSTEHLDWISGFRLHPLDGLVVAPPAFFLLGAGIQPAVVGILVALQIVVGIFLHANVRWRLRPLRGVVATPEFHHWHHANEADAHCSNYSGVFPIWDVVFGTFYVPGNKRPLRYGVDDDVPTTMRGQLRYPFGERVFATARTAVRHPVRSSRRGARCVRTVAASVWRSTTRPRLRRPRPGEPCRWAERPPVWESASSQELGRGDTRPVS